MSHYYYYHYYYYYYYYYGEDEDEDKDVDDVNDPKSFTLVWMFSFLKPLFLLHVVVFAFSLQQLRGTSFKGLLLLHLLFIQSV